MLFPATSWLPSWLQSTPDLTYDQTLKEYSSLQLEDQQQITRELYGIDFEDRIQETPEFISYKLGRLEEELDKIVEKETYETALFIMYDYVQSKKFRLAFLRADRFDEHAAARRICTFWDRKLKLFGAASAFKEEISIFDFKDEDFEALLNGGGRFLGLDASGRGIFQTCRKYQDMRLSHVESMERLYWFVCHHAVFQSEHSESIQKNGFIWLSSDGRNEGDDVPTYSTLLRAKYMSSMGHHDSTYAFPCRFVAIHGFFNHLFFLEIEQCLSLMNRASRLRAKVYNIDNTQENLRSLADFGLLSEMVPKEIGGALDFDWQNYLRERIEESEVPPERYDFAKRLLNAK